MTNHTPIHQPVRSRHRRTALLAGACAAVAAALITGPTTAQAITSPGADASALAAKRPSGQMQAIAAINDHNVWTVGDISTAGGSVTLVQHWNGHKWKRVPSPSPAGRPESRLESVTAVAPNDIWATGYSSDAALNVYPLAEHWNGKKWKIVPTPAPEGAKNTNLQTVVADPQGGIWAIGDTVDQAGTFTSLVERWNGSKFQIMDTPNPADALYTIPFGAAAISPTDVWASGLYLDFGFVAKTLAEHWDGDSWTIVPTPNPEGSSFTAMWGMAALASDDVWSVGYSTDGAGITHAISLHWDGTAWSLVPAADAPGATQTNLYAISAVSNDDLWAVGNAVDADGTVRSLVEHWDGTSWSVVKSPNGGDGPSYLWGVSSLSTADVWAGGYSVKSPGPNKALPVHWDGAAWKVQR